MKEPMRPRYKILITILILTLLLAGIWYGFLSQKNTNTYSSQIVDRNTDSILDSYADTDGDGLLNWQEELYGTSKTKGDTDGDGVSDEQEIKNNTDPTFFGEGLNTELEITPQLQVFEEYQFSADGENGLTLDSFNEILLNLSQSNTVSIDTEAGSQNQELKNTLNTLGLTIEKSYLSQDNAQLFNNLFLRNQPIDVLKINTFINNLKQTKEILEITNTHPDIATEHANIVTSYDVMARQLDAMLNGQSQSNIQYSKYLEGYTNAVADLHKNIISIHNIVIERGLSFEQGEGGYYFLFQL